MVSAAVDEEETGGLWSVRSLFRVVATHWALLAGLLVLAIPTFGSLARQTWSSDLGAHGPIVLATGLWLLSRCRKRMIAQRTVPASGILFLMLAVSLALYIFGRAYDFLFLEGAGFYLIALTMLYSLVGAGGLRVAAFPLVYLAFIVPLPGWVIAQLTVPLRNFVSFVATEGLQHLGYPIIRHGVALYIAQYQLLVEDACAGMNSIVGLTAITLFYIYVMDRTRSGYALFLLLLVIPIAIFVNLLRVVALILITYYAGDGVAQGFMHVTTGIVLFGVALVVMFLVDMTLGAAFRRSGRAPT